MIVCHVVCTSMSEYPNQVQTARMQMCIVRCMRGSRNPWRGVGFVDAASLPPNSQSIE